MLDLTNHAVKRPEFTVTQARPNNQDPVRIQGKVFANPPVVCPPRRERTHASRQFRKCILQGHKTPPQTKVAPFRRSGLSRSQLVTLWGHGSQQLLREPSSHRPAILPRTKAFCGVVFRARRHHASTAQQIVVVESRSGVASAIGHRRRCLPVPPGSQWQTNC